MATNSSQIVTSFTVSGISRTVPVDVRFNIQKRRELVVYKTVTDSDSINLSYVINKEVTVNNNLSISDKSAGLPANRIPQNIQPIVFTGKGIVLSVDRFLSTDIFTDVLAGEKTPLFYQHKLQNFNVADPNQTVTDIVMLDADLNQAAVTDIKYNFKLGYIYNNILNEFDPISGDYDIKYIRYTVKNSSSGVINSHLEVLNNQTVYRQATFDDLTPGGKIIAGLKVYVIDQFASNSYEVLFPTTQVYAVKEAPNSRIHIITPPNTGINNPWFVSVSNGNFYTSIHTTPSNSNIFLYSVPEFNTQQFSPFAPFKFKNKEASTRISNHLIKTLKNDIQNDAINLLYILVVVRNIDGSARLAMSTNPAQIGLGFENIAITSGIRSIDSLNGIIDVVNDISEKDVLEVSYYFQEKEYEVLDIDFNPITNTSIIGQRIVFYLAPNINNARTKCLFFLIVDHKGLILSTSQTDNAALLASIATNDFFYDKPSVSSLALNFLDKYTVQAIPIYIFANPANPKYLVLGEAFTGEGTHPDQSVIIDVRKSGGGIKQNRATLKQIAESVPEVQWITDEGRIDGFMYPGNGATLIEVPLSVQQSYGGKFSDPEIKQIIERHLAFGVYPIVRGYGTSVLSTAIPLTS